ncbi:ferredoxin reductase, partial [Jatrophihabitans sp.]|uniref:ferredoxin reductase n=1 Tax=Jatrophihabitans sp. TaxID=1932789 RepID=UPI0030C730FF|nr:hypothetical protein [Jatrophihabitans sp.]
MDGNDHLGPRVLRVRAVDDVADRVRAFTLEAADGQPLPSWTPGAHLDLDLAPGLTRQYSLCGPPDAETLRIAVLREVESGGGSSYLHDHVRPGTLLTVRGPRNHFPLRDAPGYLFLAGGIGITPILAMVREVAAGSVPWRLVYGARSRPAMAFLDEPPLDRDEVELCCQDTDGLPDLAALIADVTPETAIYACGPPAML